jgi:hypothetical protein
MSIHIVSPALPYPAKILRSLRFNIRGRWGRTAYTTHPPALDRPFLGASWEVRAMGTYGVCTFLIY